MYRYNPEMENKRILDSIFQDFYQSGRLHRAASFPNMTQHDVEDAIQIAYANLARTVKDHPDMEFGPFYIVSAVRNAAIDFIRSRSKWERIEDRHPDQRRRIDEVTYTDVADAGYGMPSPSLGSRIYIDQVLSMVSPENRPTMEKMILAKPSGMGTDWVQPVVDNDEEYQHLKALAQMDPRYIDALKRKRETLRKRAKRHIQRELEELRQILGPTRYEALPNANRPTLGHVVISPDQHLIDPDTGLYQWTVDRVQSAWEMSRAELDDALATGGVSKVVLMVGIPASGKTTWLEQNAESGVVYFDATFKNARARRPILDIVGRYGVPVEAVVMATPLNEALRRNRTRPPDRRVPEEFIRSQYETLTEGGMPTRREGFRRVTLVRPTET